MSLSVTVSMDPLEQRLSRLARDVADPSKPLRQWATWYGQEVWRARDAHTFARDFDVPSEFRGQVWAPIKPQYVRKTGPVADRRVPPWGGVKRLAGAVNWASSDIATGKKNFRRADRVYGNVRGRLRPSGKRVSASSLVGADTNAMFRQFTRNPVLSADRRVVTLSTNQPYAARFNRSRPFAFVTRTDKKMFHQLCLLWLKGLLRGQR